MIPTARMIGAIRRSISKDEDMQVMINLVSGVMLAGVIENVDTHDGYVELLTPIPNLKKKFAKRIFIPMEMIAYVAVKAELFDD